MDRLPQLSQQQIIASARRGLSDAARPRMPRDAGAAISSVGRLTILSLAMMMTGCSVNQWNTRFPTCMPRDPETERRAAQVQDPYPDKRMGPEMASRPPAFENQRPEPQMAKDRFYSGFLKRQYRQPAPPPAIGPGAALPGYYY